MTRPNVNEHSEEELRKMEIRELEALTDHWSRAFGDHTFTDEEIQKVRQANKIYIYRREALRKAAPALLESCKALHDALSAILESTEEQIEPAERSKALIAINGSFKALAKAEEIRI